MIQVLDANDVDFLGLVADLDLNLRQADRDEMAAAHPGADQAGLLLLSVLSSTRCFFVVEDESPIAVFGVAPGGIVWMLGTDGIARHPLRILRHTAAYLTVLHEGHPTLSNYVDAHNAVSIQWLTWAGFRFTGDVRMCGPHPFLQFARTAHV